jgi:hypothetical protein
MDMSLEMEIKWQTIATTLLTHPIIPLLNLPDVAMFRNGQFCTSGGLY